MPTSTRSKVDQKCLEGKERMDDKCDAAVQRASEAMDTASEAIDTASKGIESATLFL